MIRQRQFRGVYPSWRNTSWRNLVKNRGLNTIQSIQHTHVIEFVLLIFTFMLLATWGFAQTSPEPASPTEAPTITSNSNEVSLGIVVRGKKNKPVLDLKPEDLVVADNGTVVKISSLHLVDANSDVERF